MSATDLASASGALRARPSARTRTQIRRARQIKGFVWSAAIFIVAAAWMVTLRPQALGGPAGYVMIRGVSMLPTFEAGDLIIVRPRATYSIGDVVAYRIPSGEAGEGIVVIHRIAGGSATTGFTLLGDNNSEPDDWHPKSGDIVGKAWARIPKVGMVLGFLHAPVPMASLATGIAVAFFLIPSDRKKRAQTSSSVTTSSPSRFSSAAVTPSPSRIAPENEPSWMLPQPQEGLPAFRIASTAPASRAAAAALPAPRKYSRVTLLPVSSTTSARPSSTSAPSPPSISDAGRGIGNPPATSGHTSTARPSATS